MHRILVSLSVFSVLALSACSSPVEAPQEIVHPPAEGLLDAATQPMHWEHSYFIPTYHIAAASVTLAKGEVFQASMTILKANKEEAVDPSVVGAIVFWVWTPKWSKIVDAGRIEGSYQFGFTVEESGDYILVFEDAYGDCVILMDYNSPSELRDASVSP
jgi:hypothetical protein